VSLDINRKSVRNIKLSLQTFKETVRKTEGQLLMLKN